MQTKYLIMEEVDSIRKVLNIYSSQKEAHEMLAIYREYEDHFCFIKQVSVR